MGCATEEGGKLGSRTVRADKGVGEEDGQGWFSVKVNKEGGTRTRPCFKIILS